MLKTDQLLEGYKRFRQGYYKKNKAFLKNLALDGQAPKIAMISCCDSRVEPTIILDCDPGALFAIRNVANLVPPYENSTRYHGTSAALEFAVKGLQVESIIVLGHAQCGGIRALVDNVQISQPHTFIANWMKQLENIREEVVHDHNLNNNEQRYHSCELKGIGHSIDNLMTFPWIAERVAEGTLTLHGWYYDIKTAELYTRQNNGEFKILE